MDTEAPLALVLRTENSALARLERLSVRGFKSIRALEEFELRGVNVLIGANGAGKSNFADVFRLLSQLAHGRLQVFVKHESGADALLFGGRRRTPSLEIALEFDRRQCRYRFSVEVAGDGLVFGGEYVCPGVPQEVALAAPGTFPTVEGGTTWSGGHVEARLANLGVGSFAAYVLPAMKDWRVYHFHDTSEAAGVRCPQAVRDNLRLKADGSNLGPFLRFLRERHPRRHRDIVETVRIAAPFFGDFVYRAEIDERIELEWYHRDDQETPLGPLQISDGTLRFMCLATLLLQPPELQPDPIIIDEPELGLHPLALTVLAEMVRGASAARQVVVSTQSADLVSEFEPEDVVVVNRRNGESVFERLDSDVLQDWLKEYSVGQLWKTEVVGGGPAR